MIVVKTKNANGVVTQRGNLILNGVKCNGKRNTVLVLRLHIYYNYKFNMQINSLFVSTSVLILAKCQQQHLLIFTIICGIKDDVCFF